MSKKKRIRDNDAFGESNEQATSSNVLDYLLGEDEMPANIKKREPEIREGELHIGEFKLSLMGLEHRGESLTFEDWRDMGAYLAKHRDAIQWMIGDWANLAEPYLDQWVPPSADESDTPEGKDQWLANQTGYSYVYLRTLASVAARFPVYLRSYTNEYATFSHCRILAAAGLPDDQTEAKLQEINANLWSVSQLKKELGMSLPESKQPAIVKRTSEYGKTWRKGWSKADRVTRIEVLEELRQIVAEMEEDIATDGT
jgi:hypothetical protein